MNKYQKQTKYINNLITVDNSNILMDLENKLQKIHI